MGPLSMEKVMKVMKIMMVWSLRLLALAFATDSLADRHGTPIYGSGNEGNEDNDGKESASSGLALRGRYPRLSPLPALPVCQKGERFVEGCRRQCGSRRACSLRAAVQIED